LSAVGVTNVGANAHHCRGQIRTWLAEEASARAGLRMGSVADEDTLLGTGGGAAGVWRAMGSPEGTIAVINGDVVSDVDLGAMAKAHRRTGAVATLMTIPLVSGESALMTDASGHFIAQTPGPVDVWQSPDYAPVNPVSFGGVYLLEASVLRDMPDGVACLIRQGIGPLLAAGSKVACLHHPGFWADLGTPARFLDATRRVLQDPSCFAFAGLPARADGRVVHELKAVHPNAQLIGPLLIAEGAIVEANAVVGPNVVIGAGCRVGRGARLQNAVLMHGAVANGECVQRIVSASAELRVAAGQG
jgi:mannose-1-phosphate guanylyltransferase